MTDEATPQLRLAQAVPRSVCEGPGERFAIWVSGCSIRCPGCCNPELFERDAGQPVDVQGLARTIAAQHRQAPLQGLSVLGGEPLEQCEAVVALLRALAVELDAAPVTSTEFGTIIFTGYEFEPWREQLRREGRGGLAAQLCRLVDSIVAGPFDARRREPLVGGRRYIGSTNQSLIHLSPRYARDELWRGPASAEVQIDARGQVSVHGEPELTRRVRLALN